MSILVSLWASALKWSYKPRKKKQMAQKHEASLAKEWHLFVVAAARGGLVGGRRGGKTPFQRLLGEHLQLVLLIIVQGMLSLPPATSRGAAIHTTSSCAIASWGIRASCGVFHPVGMTGFFVLVKLGAEVYVGRLCDGQGHENAPSTRVALMQKEITLLQAAKAGSKQ